MTDKNARHSKRSYGDGSIDQRGEDVYRLRYRVDGRRFTKTFKGKLTDARKELRRLLREGDTGDHVEPSKLTVGQWIDTWIAAGAPGRRKKKVGQKTLERYEELLRVHVKPKLGAIRLQKLQATEVDRLYTHLDELVDESGDRQIAPMTLHHVHVVLNSCLSTAERKGLILANPMRRVEQVPNPQEQILDDEEADADDIGEGLDDVELARLIAGFERSSLYPVVVLAAATGARRNELLALRWINLDIDKKTLRIERAWEQTKKFGLRLKPPKTKRGLRTIELDDATLTMLLKEKERHQRIIAGIPDGPHVDLSLIKLPAGALMFPAVPEPGEDFDFTKPRNPRNFSKEFARRADHLREQARKAELPSFAKTRFHDLRGIHSTALLDAGIPVHTVAQRIGDDPAVLLRNYAKRKRSKKANQSVAAAIAAIASGFLGK
ncbi:site-specific integrase [Bradyrhizobium sp. Arg237L]|uniref:site-specific integrase n=1 Tax=Bradyrhizobium sp. Arg237L TaxID=3003352 RepID=UPI00249E3421|nr:site-specific integrase [Bradyrhizobium sp. Arg237L]MDI4231426.1 site-specific integrase [Bradyrhizobium sp. Arg237L]